MFVAIGLSGNKTMYTTGSSLNVTCFSNFTVQVIYWTSSSSVIPFSNKMIGSQELLLNIGIISASTNGTTLKCEVITLLPTGGIVSAKTSFIIYVKAASKSDFTQMK